MVLLVLLYRFSKMKSIQVLLNYQMANKAAEVNPVKPILKSEDSKCFR